MKSNAQISTTFRREFCSRRLS